MNPNPWCCKAGIRSFSLSRFQQVVVVLGRDEGVEIEVRRGQNGIDHAPTSPRLEQAMLADLAAPDEIVQRLRVSSIGVE